MKKSILSFIKFVLPIIFIMGFTLFIHTGIKTYEFNSHILDTEASNISKSLEIGIYDELYALTLVGKEDLFCINRCTDYAFINEDKSVIYDTSSGCVTSLVHNYASNSKTFDILLSYAKLSQEKVFIDEDEYLVIIVPIYDNNKFEGFIIGQTYIKDLLDIYSKRVLNSLFFNYSIKHTSYEGESFIYGSELKESSIGQQEFTIYGDTFQITTAFKREWVRFVWFLSFSGGLLLTSIFLLIVYKNREYSSSRLIYMDTLTKAYNKRMLTKVLNEHKKDDIPFTLIYLDIDKFKFVNDTNGHNTGDLLLINFADRVMNSVKKQDMLFRVGGDEFILLVEGDLTEETIRSIIDRIYDSLDTSFDLSDVILDISVSAGYSRFPIDSRDPETLIDIADSYMYKTKHSQNK